MKVIEKYWFIIFFLFVFFIFNEVLYCFFLLGIIILFYAIEGVLFLNNLSKKGIKSFGKILSYESDNDGYKIPIVEFQTQDGRFIRKKPYYHASSDIDKFISVKKNINKTVRIVYEENDPEKFVIKIDKEFSYGTQVLMIIIGLIFLCVGINKFLGNINFYP